jgi:hypothetical protein
MLNYNKYSQFGRVLATIALENEVKSQTQLSKVLRISDSKLHGLLHGKCCPSPEIVNCVKERLRVSEGDYKQLLLEAIRSYGWPI